MGQEADRLELEEEVGDQVLVKERLLLLLLDRIRRGSGRRRGLRKGFYEGMVLYAVCVGLHEGALVIFGTLVCAGSAIIISINFCIL